MTNSFLMKKYLYGEGEYSEGESKSEENRHNNKRSWIWGDIKGITIEDGCEHILQHAERVRHIGHSTKPLTRIVCIFSRCDLCTHHKRKTPAVMQLSHSHLQPVVATRHLDQTASLAHHLKCPKYCNYRLTTVQVRNPHASLENFGNLQCMSNYTMKFKVCYIEWRVIRKDRGGRIRRLIKNTKTAEYEN